MVAKLSLLKWSAKSDSLLTFARKSQSSPILWHTWWIKLNEIGDPCQLARPFSPIFYQLCKKNEWKIKHGGKFII
jgi:hypothetical protein